MFRKVSIPQIVEDVSNYKEARRKCDENNYILKELKNSRISCLYKNEIKKYEKLLKISKRDILRYMRILEDRYLTTISADQAISNFKEKRIENSFKRAFDLSDDIPNYITPRN